MANAGPDTKISSELVKTSLGTLEIVSVWPMLAQLPKLLRDGENWPRNNGN